MSETVHYLGTLKKLDKLSGETLEEQCKRLTGLKELPKYCDTYQEYVADEGVSTLGLLLYKDDIYKVESTRLDQDEDIFRAVEKENGEIEFEVRYYNGGCGFEEAVGEALENVSKHN